MGAILNGLALHGGIMPFGATFLIFSDYMRPAIRLAALMELPRHLRLHARQHRRGRRRADPPAGGAPRIAAGHSAPHGDPPGRRQRDRAGLALCPVAAPRAGRAGADPAGPARSLPPNGDLARGAYVLADAAGTPDLILIASGSEVSLAMEARDRLAAEGIGARVVSMPSWELFDAQPKAYRDQVLPPAVKARSGDRGRRAAGLGEVRGRCGRGDVRRGSLRGIGAGQGAVRAVRPHQPATSTARARALLGARMTGWQITRDDK